MNSHSKSISLTYTQGALIYIVILTLFRLWFCTQTELAADEAYYWLWSNHIDWSYFSKGPGVAWVIALGTFIFGDNVFGVRFFSVLLAAGTGWLMFLLGKKLFSERVGFWSIVIAGFVPLFLLGSMVMTIDPISVFFWALAAWLFWKNLDRPSPWAWVTTGVAVGLGILAKYTNIAELVCFAVFCAWSGSHRKYLIRPKFWIMIITTLLFFTPIFIWNSHHHWITFQHLIHRGALDEKWTPSFSELWEFIYMQALVFHPLFLIALLGSLATIGLQKLRSDSYRYLLSLFLPLILFYLILSLNKAGQANWTAPSYVAGVLLLTSLWIEKCDRTQWIRRLTQWTLVLSACIIILFHIAFFLYLPDLFPQFKIDPLRRLRGAKDIARQTAEVAQQNQASFIIGNKYSFTSLLAFYYPNPKTEVFTPSHDDIQNQFSFWPQYPEKYTGQSAIYVSDANEIPESLRKEFLYIQPVKETFSRFQGKPLRKFYLFYCNQLQDMENGGEINK